MSTPIRNLVQKTLSPCVLKSAKSYNRITPPRNIEISERKNYVKSLQFSTSKIQKQQHNDLGVSVLNNLESNISGISINVTETDSPKKNLNSLKLPIINSPERLNILENGLFKYKWNILGKGSFGTVVQAIYKGKKVAMKITSTKQNQNLQDFNALKLDHPNIISVLRVDDSANQYGLIVMKDYSAVDLQQILENKTKKITIKMIVQWTIDLCNALQHCHSKNILHLDVKPKNILIRSEDNSCVLCDFGSSLDLSCSKQINKFLQDRIKHGFDVLGGTVIYMAPELFCNKIKTNNLEIPSSTSKLIPVLTSSTDVYSLGITMWQMYSREIPYNHLNFDNIHSIIYAVVKHNFRPKFSPDVYIQYQNLYIRCWSTEPEMRPSILEVLNTLQSFYTNINHEQ